MRGGWYRTGDVARARRRRLSITYVGRADDVFKASDYRISPFELESVLIEHPAVAEAAVVPSPDPLRLAVPKAFVALRAGHAAGRGDGALDLRVPARSSWRRTSACAASSLPSCRRRSPARSGAWICASARPRRAPRSAPAPPSSSKRRRARAEHAGRTRRTKTCDRGSSSREKRNSIARPRSRPSTEWPSHPAAVAAPDAPR